jgi:Predicted beta-xylosidase
MKKLRWFIIFFIIWGLLGGNVNLAVKGGVSLKKYVNPVGHIENIGDPFVLKYNRHYYLYATSLPGSGFYVWESANLVEWQLKGVALDKTEPGNEWGMADFWAPEVIFYHGQFYMTYSARDTDGHLKIVLAAAANPLDPFKNIKVPLVFRDNCSWIDAHVFIEDNGTPYLFYVKDCSENIIRGIHMSQIYVQELSAGLTAFIGEPVLALEPDQAWEGINKDWQWNEGPFVIKHDGIYYLMYSANAYDSPDYAIGYATAKNPLGPWTKYTQNPILVKNNAIGVSGPGHNSVTSSPDGSELFIVYHSHTYPELPSGNRTVNIDRLYFDNGKLKVKGPTRSPQSLPSGV